PVSEIYDYTGIDPWFLDQLVELIEHEKRIVEAVATEGLDGLDAEFLRETKALGFSDRQIANAVNAAVGAAGDPSRKRVTEWDVRAHRKALGILPNYKLVDTCAAEFESYTPYYYSTYEDGEDEVSPVTDADGKVKDAVMVLGGGPNRIGQGIEFDYCCVHAAFAMNEIGYATVMVNSNPETVSTDFDTSDMLFFEPLTHEDVMNVVERIAPKGIIVQFGGQTPLNLARGLKDHGAPLVGTSVESIEAAEDRDLFAKVCTKLGIAQPPNGMASTLEQAAEIADRVGYPVVVRPSFVLGGRAMEVVYDHQALSRYMAEQGATATAERPILVDKFVEGAIEIDVDAISDGESVVVGGIMEHIEEAGVHSGDSSCSLPPYTLSDGLIAKIAESTHKLARELGVVGLMNVQYAVQGSRLFIIEANPRASRTVPFVAKAIGKPLAKIAAKAMLGHRLAEFGLTEQIVPPYFSVKAPVFPFNKFQGVDTVLGPEMKSTGEVMGIDRNFGAAFAKAMMGASVDLPKEGAVFLSVRDEDKRFLLGHAARL
ncbi:MAG: carbamoyl-phosphate synthase large subunit, partial [Planctomycetes bacterium]|nr:carbamoyl-phosphate synthase large subunit [Planctomycetota bacterium]